MQKLQYIPAYRRIGQISDPDFYAQRYAKAVEYTDLQVGWILDTLESTGRLERALIVLTADHGESFDERDLWFDHGTHASEEQLHVPLVIHFPDGKRGGEVADELVGLMDVAPTVINVLNLEPMAAADGRSLRLDGSGHAILMGESSHCKSAQEPVLDVLQVEYMEKRFRLGPTVKRSSMRWKIRGPFVMCTIDRTIPMNGLHWLNPVVSDGVQQRLIGMRGRIDQIQEVQKSDEESSTEELETLKALGYVE